MSSISKTALPAQSALWRMVQPGDFIDGYAAKSDLTPAEALQIGLSLPGWAKSLMALRNRIVAPLGLKTEVSDAGSGALFPITHQDDTEVILGADDRHLNFRIAILRQAGQIHMATWVHRNNLLGRIYLAVVMPFHVLIVRNSMHRIARATASGATAPRRT
ncbi:MAG: DUF2867 domain-containing protein [Rhodobacteraceae bacterium]|nr:DUF2867 domain-containing protein [Paracoccaceae bacterium]